MVIGLCTVDLEFPESGSLKTKRQTLQSVLARVRQQFNVSIAEVGHQDSWQLATVAMTCVSTDAAYIHGLFERAVRYIDEGPFSLVLLDYQTELF
ncbi:MAG TPA: DUF503 domain-containing protein [Chloroflexi bacterium]|nr:DUF503 domain-containing protein [Chloroflexota bacterium]